MSPRDKLGYLGCVTRPRLCCIVIYAPDAQISDTLTPNHGTLTPPTTLLHLPLLQNGEVGGLNDLIIIKKEEIYDLLSCHSPFRFADTRNTLKMPSALYIFLEV